MDDFQSEELENTSESREKIISNATVLLSNVVGRNAHDFLYLPVNDDNVIVADLIVACVFQLDSVVESGDALEWRINDLRTCIGMVLKAFITDYYQLHKDEHIPLAYPESAE